MNENIFNKLFKQGVLGLCAFDVLDLLIAEKVKIASSLAAHIVPLAPTGVCLYCPCIRAKETLKKSPIQPPCRKWPKPCRKWHIENYFLPPSATPRLLSLELGMHLDLHGPCSYSGSQFHWSSLLSATLGHEMLNFLKLAKLHLQSVESDTKPVENDMKYVEITVCYVE